MFLRSRENRLLRPRLAIFISGTEPGLTRGSFRDLEQRNVGRAPSLSLVSEDAAVRYKQSQRMPTARSSRCTERARSRSLSPCGGMGPARRPCEHRHGIFDRYEFL